jgi:hypothetical protein
MASNPRADVIATAATLDYHHVSSSSSVSSIVMDLGSNFAAKLEPFLLIAKSVKGAAAAKLIQDATAAPGVFVFSELLELPNIREVFFIVPIREI